MREGVAGLSRDKTRLFKLSTDPKFVTKLHDIVGLYVDTDPLCTTSVAYGPDHLCSRQRNKTVSGAKPPLASKTQSTNLTPTRHRRRDECSSLRVAI